MWLKQIDRLNQKRHTLLRARSMRKVQAQVKETASFEPALQKLDDAALRDHFQGLRPHFADGVHYAALPEAFACVREAIRRVSGMRAFDVQVMAGLVMARGHLAEMATGEGKTLVAALPASVLALAGKGVHLATVNAYLAERDFEIMRPGYEFLGLSVALLPERAPPDDKREAYAADVTYGTGYEFGFDYLRDQLAKLQQGRRPLGTRFREDLMPWSRQGGAAPAQRPLAYAIVDEIDSVLIDEAVTPLILSRAQPPGENPQAWIYRRAHAFALKLEEESDYTLDSELEKVSFLQEGLAKVYEDRPDVARGGLRRAWHEYIEQALRAIHFYQRDVQYLNRDDAVEIIDENTGRSFADRKWRGGLHQAVEAKEAVEVSHETDSDVTISRQRFYQLYPFLSGMTGTAQEAQGEFLRVYGLRVYPIPRNRPLQRLALPTRVFADRSAKYAAMVEAIAEAKAAGRPVLIGTRTVQQSDEVARALKAAGIRSILLNARQDAEEAEVVGRAGHPGRVTIATNMAGRGADIPLGEGVAEAGGLFVLGEERNESRRIDRQLEGRAGRQGEPGSAQFFLSMEDHLVERLKKAPDAKLAGELPERYAGMIDGYQLKLEQELGEKRTMLMRNDVMLDKLKRHT